LIIMEYIFLNKSIKMIWQFGISFFFTYLLILVEDE